MTDTEGRLRDALAEYDNTAPDIGEVMAGINAGIKRRRRRNTAAGAIATVAAVAAVIPLYQAVGPRHRDVASLPPPSRPAPTALATTIDYAPTWLPKGVTEFERVINEQGKTATARVFSGPVRIKVTDSPSPDRPVSGVPSDSFSLGVAQGTGFAVQNGYEIQRPWRSGRWLKVIVTGPATAGQSGGNGSTAADIKTARVDAIQVAGSVQTSPPAGIDLPISCTIAICHGKPIVSVFGNARGWRATLDQGRVELVLSNNYGTATDTNRQWPQRVRGYRARFDKEQLLVDLGGGDTATFAAPDSQPQQPTNRQLLQAAKSALPIQTVDYSWLGTRP
ncbi:MAG: hypothetical protein J2P17_03510 [Mycobacterium sp.]|nr:hypothetical protein [Mycobacterium sp.]